VLVAVTSCCKRTSALTLQNLCHVRLNTYLAYPQNLLHVVNVKLLIHNICNIYHAYNVYNLWGRHQAQQVQDALFTLYI
jgi:hypothetical protein